MHKHGFIHRDIKPENMLSSPTDPSKVALIDFGISWHIKSAPPTRYDPLKELKDIVGTLHWASLNAHNGIGGWLVIHVTCMNSLKIIDLGPRDDLESLAYTAFFLLRGDLPWRTSDSHSKSMKHSMQRIRASKAASGDKLGDSFPAEFGYLLYYSRRLEYDQMPDYVDLKYRFTDLNGRVGGNDTGGPLDWSSVRISISEEHNSSEIAHIDDDLESEDENDESSEEENFKNSYCDWDIADWDIQGARDRSLTLPIEQVELADSIIPQIVEVMM
jgi:serine/threonine protein kinase